MSNYPIIAVSAPDDGLNPVWLVDIESLSGKLAGLALVYGISFVQARRLTDRLTKAWSVFLGACRIYKPKFDQYNQTPYDHPLLLGQRLNTPEERHWGLSWLCRETASLSTNGPEIYERMPRFNDISGIIRGADVQRRLNLETAPTKRLELLEIENKNLKQQNASVLEMAAEVDFERQSALANFEEVKRSNFYLQQRITVLDAVLISSAKQIKPDRPNNYQEIADWIEKNYPGRLVLVIAHPGVIAPFPALDQPANL